MSFLSGIYSKVLGTSTKKTVEVCSNSATTGTGFTEDYDNEDGFVLYTSEQNKRYKQAEFNTGTGNYKSYENFQQSSPYPPAGSTSYMTPTTSLGGKATPQKRDTTFLTVSDLPMQLSKQLQAMLHVNQGTGDILRRSAPNIEQYCYDFTLERDVIRTFESASVG